jgi:cytokinin dehydrogenase
MFPAGQLPALDGVLAVDEASRAAAAADFGGIVHHRPRAVLRPGSVADIAAVLRAAAEHGLTVVPRGQGHTTYGQAQAAGGVVVEMSALRAVQRVAEDRVTVQAGARWSEVLAATLPLGLTPPVLADYLELSVGGTLSAGGIGGTSHRHGLQVDTVLELDVLTGSGELRTCSPARDRELFDAVRGGLGRYGVIVRATLALVPAPRRARRYRLGYPDLRTLIADQRLLLAERRFDYLEGQILPDGHGGWRHLLEVAAFDGSADPWEEAAPLRGLRHHRDEEDIDELSFPDFLDRMAPGVALLRETGEWHHPHPWWNAFVPGSAADDLVPALVRGMRPEDVGPSGLVLCYPFAPGMLTAPMVRVPAEPVAFLLAVLRTAPAGDPPVARAMVEDNRRLSDQVAAVGGFTYPIGSVAFAERDWRAHYGPLGPGLARLAARNDPGGVLRSCGGHG